MVVVVVFVVFGSGRACRQLWEEWDGMGMGMGIGRASITNHDDELEQDLRVTTNDPCRGIFLVRLDRQSIERNYLSLFPFGVFEEK